MRGRSPGARQSAGGGPGAALAAAVVRRWTAGRVHCLDLSRRPLSAPRRSGLRRCRWPDTEIAGPGLRLLGNEVRIAFDKRSVAGLAIVEVDRDEDAPLAPQCLGLSEQAMEQDHPGDSALRAHHLIAD